MTKEEMRALIREEIAAIAPESTDVAIGDDEDLREALDLDSMDIFNLVAAVSARLGVDIAEADVGRLATLRSGTAFLHTLHSSRR